MARHPGAQHITFPKFHDGQKGIYKAVSQLPRSVLRCGRRYGKTTLLETAAGNWSRKGLKVGWFSPNYKLLLPSYKRILKTMRPLVLHSSKVDSIIELENDGLVEFWTLNDEDAGRSRSYDWVIIDEGSLVKKGLKETWETAIAPTLLDRRGSCVMAGTPKGIDPDNFFHEACTDPKLGFREFHAPTRDNPMLDPDGVANLVNEYPPLVYQQEFLAEFVDWNGAAFFSLDSLLVNGQPIPYPVKCDAVFAVIDSATKTGKEHDGTAVMYFSTNRVGTPLTILDWDIVQIEGALLETWLPTVFQNLEHLAQTTGARFGSVGVQIEDKASGMILLQQALRRGWDAKPIESELTAVGKEERAINVSGYVYRGMIKLSQFAHDKTVTYKTQSRNHMITQVCGFRIGEKDQADDLLDTFTYGIALALGDSEGSDPWPN